MVWSFFRTLLKKNVIFVILKMVILLILVFVKNVILTVKNATEWKNINVKSVIRIFLKRNTLIIVTYVML